MLEVPTVVFINFIVISPPERRQLGLEAWLRTHITLAAGEQAEQEKRFYRFERRGRPGDLYIVGQIVQQDAFVAFLRHIEQAQKAL